MRGREGALEIGQIGVVMVGLGEEEAAEGKRDEGNTERPDVRFNSVWRSLNMFGLGW